MNTKIALSDKELELVCNTEWILTKHTIIQKVYQLFGEMQPLLQEQLNKGKEGLPPQIFTTAPKISKGENYKGLPYVMLDYPRHFLKDEVMAIRTLFWWGHFFSITLHLEGDIKNALLEKMGNRFLWLQQRGYAVCVNQSPWEHHFEPDNYMPLSTMNQQSFVDILNRKPFLKLSKHLSLNQWEAMPGFIAMVYDELATLLKND